VEFLYAHKESTAVRRQISRNLQMLTSITCISLWRISLRSENDGKYGQKFSYGPKQYVAFIALLVTELMETPRYSMGISCGYASVAATVGYVV